MLRYFVINHILFFQIDGTGTIASEDRLKAQPSEPQTNGSSTELGAAAPAEAAGAVPINENLFTEDDLDGIDDELEDLDIAD